MPSNPDVARPPGAQLVRQRSPRDHSRAGRGGSERSGGERGAILILTAVFMIAALMLTAFAVDMGRMRARRAQYQHVADAAALYGGYLVNNGETYPDAAVSVQRFVRQNLGLPLSAWSGCTDVKHLPWFPAGNECISFDYGPSDPSNPASPKQYFSRVRIPPQTLDFAFAPGSGTVTASAGVDGNTAACDPLDPGVCVSISTTTTTRAPTTTRRPTPSTTRPPAPTTTRPVTPTTRPPVTSTTRPRVTTTTRPRVTTTTRPASPSTTRPAPPTTRPAPTTTRPATSVPPTTIDISF